MDLVKHTALKKHLGQIDKELLLGDNKKCFDCQQIKSLEDFEPTKKKLLKSDKGRVRVCKNCISKRKL
tara:strand:- start:350 stop:553 length:204 start_codon:yes stop_codon:yes gene_type:complete